MKPAAIIIAFLMGICTGLLAQTSINKVIRAEKLFAQMALDKNARDAFLTYMCDKSVIDVQGKFVKGIPVYKKQGIDTSGKLIWSPSFAAISASGDLGYTTGPWLYRTGGKDVASGNYATVWQKQPNGQWKFLIDLGNSSAQEQPGKQDSVQSLLPDEKIKLTGGNNNLISVDNLFAKAIDKGGIASYKNYLHPQAHILWPGNTYIATGEKNAFMNEQRHIIFHPQQSYVAQAKDFAVVYGTCEISPALKENNHQSALYMHVWRKDKGQGWQLLHETIK